MNFEEAKMLFVEKYGDLRLELTDENDRELLFTNPRYDKSIRLPINEIEEYLAFEHDRLNYDETPAECSICSKSYREHLLTMPLAVIRPSRFIARNEPIYFGDPASASLYAEVSEASNIFNNYFRFNEFYLELVSRVNVFNRNVEQEYIDIADLQRRPHTIKIMNINAPDIETAVRSSDRIIESCLFQLSYMKSLTVFIAENWPLRHRQHRPFQFVDLIRGNGMELPQIACNSDVLRFYQRGMSTDDPVLQYLSFYQVIEYFFLEVSDELLYNKLSRRLKDPNFSISFEDLDCIILDVTKHKRETDETEMLKLVLNKYIDEEVLIRFIEAYESHIDQKIYTKKQKIFGTDLEIKLQGGHVVSNIAKRIKTIRNALVHASDRYERSERYIPNSENEYMVKCELPLLQHLAERVIIASSQPFRS